MAALLNIGDSWLEPQTLLSVKLVSHSSISAILAICTRVSYQTPCHFESASGISEPSWPILTPVAKTSPPAARLPTNSHYPFTPPPQPHILSPLPVFKSPNPPRPHSSPLIKLNQSVTLPSSPPPYLAATHLVVSPPPAVLSPFPSRKPPAVKCGDKICTAPETPKTCSKDCPGRCGDGICNLFFESCASCLQVGGSVMVIHMIDKCQRMALVPKYLLLVTSILMFIQQDCASLCSGRR